MLRVLGQTAAQALDVELMAVPGFSIDQLMELAGLSVACAIAAEYGPQMKVLTLCGPGNNGGDGLVASRHLKHFGYDVDVVYPKRPQKSLFQNLVTQLDDLEIPVRDSVPDYGQYDLVIDALFGFSFTGTSIREPYKEIIDRLVQSNVPIASVDIPSGWNVEEGDINGVGINPDMLISLTVPKLCAKYFKGQHHYVGGRFLPPKLAIKYNIEMPRYQGTDQCVKITPDMLQQNQCL